MAENKTQKKERIEKIIRLLGAVYPDAHCELIFSSPWELLVATMLSAQCTDKRVNMVTPELFKRYPTINAFASAEIIELEKLIHSTGFYKNKSKNIKAAANLILEKHAGKVPNTMDDLVLVPGVGRKTANVVLGNCFGIPGLTVDTHMIRINKLLGLSHSDDAVKVEAQLMKIIPEKDWIQYTHLIIRHGRARCIARRPDCGHCEIQIFCPFGALKRSM